MRKKPSKKLFVLKMIAAAGLVIVSILSGGSASAAAGATGTTIFTSSYYAPAPADFDSRLNLMLQGERVMFYKGLANGVDVDALYKIFDGEDQLAFVKVVWVDTFSSLAVVINSSSKIREGKIYKFKYAPAGVGIQPRPGKYAIPKRDSDKKTEVEKPKEVQPEKKTDETVRPSLRYNRAGKKSGDENAQGNGTEDLKDVETDDGTLKLKAGYEEPVEPKKDDKKKPEKKKDEKKKDEKTDSSTQRRRTK